MTTPSAVIVAAVRSPIGKAARGSLVDVRADDLLTQTIDALLDRAPGLDADDVDDLIVGTWMASGEQGSNIARRVAVLLGADALPATTVNRACTSSLQALRMAAHAIVAGEATCMIAGGVESISRYEERRAAGTTADHVRHPAFVAAAERNARVQADAAWRNPRDDGGLPDVHIAMGRTAENVARLRGVTRADQDAFAVLSQQRAAAAITRGRFATEINPITTPTGNVVSTDDSPRPSTTAEALAALTPAFAADGTVTAGNCCPLNDGAAAVLVMAEDTARTRGYTPLARIVGTAVSALSPEVMGLGPVEATQRLLDRTGWAVGDIDLIELNEAFAAQVLPCIDDLGLDVDRVNVDGGAIALGHPFGMGGARLVTTLLTSMLERDAGTGLVTMCAAGGQGMSVLIERV